MQALPYVVVTKEGVAKVYEVRALAVRRPTPHTLTNRAHVPQLYWSAFEK